MIKNRLVALTVAIFTSTPVILSPVIAWNGSAHAAAELTRRSFLQALATLIGSQALPATAPNIPPGKTIAQMKLEFLQAFDGSDYPRRLFLGEAERRAAVAANYAIDFHGEYLKRKPAKAVMSQANELLDELVELADRVAKELKLPVEQVHEELMHALVPQMDFVVPEGKFYAGVTPRMREFAPLGRDFQDQLLAAVRERMPRFGGGITSSTLNTRNFHRYFLPEWARLPVEIVEGEVAGEREVLAAAQPAPAVSSGAQIARQSLRLSQAFLKSLSQLDGEPKHVSLDESPQLVSALIEEPVLCEEELLLPQDEVESEK